MTKQLMQNDKTLKGENCPQMSLSQTPSPGWNPYYVLDRWQASFLLNTTSFKEFMKSSSIVRWFSFLDV